jgi:hypothetical protein
MNVFWSNFFWTTLLVGSALRAAAMTQQAYLKPSDISLGANFGWTVSVSGDTAVAGVPFENSSSGGAYVFVRNGTNWIEQAHLTASNAGGGDQFGATVAISGDTIVVGANDEASGATGVNGDGSNDNLPYSGAAYVFTRSGTSWTQQAYLKASNPGTNDEFGYSVAISGDTIVVGARFEDSRYPGIESDNSLPNSGAAYVFTRTGTNWSQQAYLKPLNPGQNFNFGWSVSVSSNTVVVGTPFESTTALASGAAYVFVRNGTNWTQQRMLKSPSAVAHDQLGASVAVSGDTLIAGANLESASATNSGAAFVFVRAGTNWTQQAYLKASNPGADDQFGWFVGLSGDIAVVGAKREDSDAIGINAGDPTNNNSTNSGAAYVFVRCGTNWIQQAYLKASNNDPGDHFGYAVAVSGETVIVGAPLEASATGDPADNHLSGAGAAYVFTGFAPPPPLSITQSNGSVQLSWPLAAADFRLEAAIVPDASTSANWAEVPPPYQTNGSQIFITVPTSGGQEFYRLQK